MKERERERKKRRAVERQKKKKKEERNRGTYTGCQVWSSPRERQRFESQLAQTTALSNQDKSRAAVNNCSINFQAGFHLLLSLSLFQSFFIFCFAVPSLILFRPLESPLLCSLCICVIEPSIARSTHTHSVLYSYMHVRIHSVEY